MTLQNFTLGTFAQQGVAAAAPSFESIATTTVGAGGVGNVTFSSIPGTYKHLQLRIVAFESNDGVIRFQFNNDTANNYSYHSLIGNGSSASAGGSGSTQIDILYNYSTGYASTSPTVAIVDLLDYSDTNKYKTLRSLGGVDYNGSGRILFESGSWRNTAAVTSIKIIAEASKTFAQYSHFALYGIKAA